MSESFESKIQKRSQVSSEKLPVAGSAESRRKEENEGLIRRKRKFLNYLLELVMAGNLMYGGVIMMTPGSEGKSGGLKVEDVSKRSEEDKRKEDSSKEWKRRWPTASQAEKEFARHYGRFPSAEELALKLKTEELEKQFGKGNVPMWHETGSGTPDSPERRRDLERIVASDIVGSDGTISKSDTAELLAVFPQQWVGEEVAFIVQHPGEKYPKEKLEEYGIKDAVAVATCAGGYKGRKAEIILYSLTTSRPLRDNFETLAHELAHANDWDSDLEMSYRERLELLEAIGERLSDSDRYQSWYVESIQNPDKKKERYLKATEYWAEIVKQYFTNPDKLHIKDFEIVDRHVKRHDPKYDVVSARDKMGSVIWSAMDESEKKRILRALQ